MRDGNDLYTISVIAVWSDKKSISLFSAERRTNRIHVCDNEVSHDEINNNLSRINNIYTWDSYCIM